MIVSDSGLAVIDAGQDPPQARKRRRCLSGTCPALYWMGHLPLSMRPFAAVGFSILGRIGRRQQTSHSRDGISCLQGLSTEPLMDLTVGQLLDNAAERLGDADALVAVHQDIRWSWARLRDEADPLAAGLIAREAFRRSRLARLLVGSRRGKTGRHHRRSQRRHGRSARCRRARLQSR